MKRCTKCGEVKALEEFGKDKRCRDGRVARCKKCLNAAAKARAADGRYDETRKRWEARNRDEIRDRNRENMRRWRAANPERARAQSRKDMKRLLERNPDYFNEWYWKNAEKERERSKAVMRRVRAENPDWDAETRRRYRANNLEAVRAREREKTYARRAKQPSSPELAAFMAELVTMPCSYCGATEGITVDHIIPLSRGGKHEADNLAPACLPCNASKNNRLPSEWDGRLDLAG